MKDGWTVKPKTAAILAQYEHTIVVTENGCEILTRCVKMTPSRRSSHTTNNVLPDGDAPHLQATNYTFTQNHSELPQGGEEVNLQERT